MNSNYFELWFVRSLLHSEFWEIHSDMPKDVPSSQDDGAPGTAILSWCQQKGESTS